MKRLLPAIVAFALTIAIILPTALSQPQSPDEGVYAWTAAYYGSRLLGLDFSPNGTDAFYDPGWSPRAFFALTQPMAGRYAYALVMAITGTQPPDRPHDWSLGDIQAPDTMLAPDGLLTLRLVSVLAAALGLSLIACRFGWAGTFATTIMLLLPGATSVIGLVALEGWLLLAYGLAALSYGTRLFAPICGLAAAVKLTALGLWPLVLIPGAFGQRRPPRWCLLAPLVWTVVMPPSWYFGGPAYLYPMLVHRLWENAGQAAHYGGIAGLYLPLHYLMPVELTTGLIVATLGGRALSRAIRFAAPVVARPE